MKIGILGGTFDPVHYGHIHLALSLKELCGLDRVLFSPSHRSPFKKMDKYNASPSQRLEMLKLALKGVPDCEVIEYEVLRLETSYTIDLVRYVKSLYGEQDQLFLLLGEDLAANFSEWKEYEQILSLATPVLGCRSLDGHSNFEDFPQLIRKGRMQIPILEISSTHIRERIKKKLYCQHLICEKVFDYICKNRIYF